MGCKAAVQALQKADVLKAKVCCKSDLLNDSQPWTDQQQLQTIYHQVLVLDLEYALDKKVEQELWNIGFKIYINNLQEQVRDKKNPHRSNAQALLSYCLEAASGFYICLLHELCSTFNLDLPFRKQLSITGQFKTNAIAEQVNPPRTSSCIYVCQYCLVHLGDIARYRNQRKQAESFYKHAILLSPTSGQPYNQLALLEASQGDKLSTIFYYVRGIAVKNPFPATATNLSNTFSLAIDKDDVITEVQTKLSVSEFIRMFVSVHGLMYSCLDLDQAELQVKSLNANLTPLVATQSFSKRKLLQMTVINLYALRHTIGTGNYKMEELTEDENKIRRLVLELLAGSMSAFLLPIYTLNQDSTLLDYHALPAIKFLLCWLKKEPDVLMEPVFQSRLQIWPGLCKLLNNAQNYVENFNYHKYFKTPLSEDVELQGFLPLAEYFTELDFNEEKLEADSNIEKLIRAKRLIDFGIWLTTLDINNLKLVVTKKEEEKNCLLFEPGSIQPDPTKKLLEEMKSFTISESVSKIKGPEKKAGILKPQGSLEKSRKEQEAAALTDLSKNSNTGKFSPPIKCDSAKLKRVGQNVALQSIFKKLEENKQVKFDMGSVEKEKFPKNDIKPSSVIKPPTTPYLNQVYHHSSNFNQTVPDINNDLQRDYYKSAFQNYNTAPYERNLNQNSGYSKPDISTRDLQNTSTNLNFSIPPPNMYNTPPLQSLNQSTTGFPQPNMSSIQRTQSNQQQMPIAYQNLPQFAQQSREFKTWQQEERPPQNWWPNSTQPVVPNYQPREYPMGYSYNNPSYLPNIDFGKQQNSQGTSAINPNWSSVHTNFSQTNGLLGLNHSNQAMSLRQAMLKESKSFASPMQDLLTSNQDIAEKTVQNAPNNSGGYSLFNSNIWSPSIPGQFQNSENSADGLSHNLRHQSLFSRPQHLSLQQLLERQNQLKKGES